MENLFLTSLTTSEVRQLFRDELVTFFGNTNESKITPQKETQPVTTKQLCEFLGVTQPTIIRWRRKGKIPFMQIGSAVRFNLSAVISALEVRRKIKG